MTKRVVKKEKIIEKKSNSLNTKEFYIALAIMGVLIILVLLVPIIKNSMSSFDYKGMTFTKERNYDILFYHYFYFYEVAGESIKYNLYLRGDPRKNDVPVDAMIIYTSTAKFVYLSINNTDINNCNESILAVQSITQFLSGNGYTVKSAIPNKLEATNKSIRFADCSSNPENMVIVMSKKEKTQIIKEGQLCYRIEVEKCQDLLKAVEKFEVQSILDAKQLQ